VTSSGTLDANITNSEKVLPEVCSNLLTEDSSGLIRVSHISVKEYLQQRKSSPENIKEFKAPNCHAQAALSCLFFMKNLPKAEWKNLTSSHEFSSTFNDTSEAGFPSYAITYWPKHYLDAFKHEQPSQTLAEQLGQTLVEQLRQGLVAYLVQQVDGPERLMLLGLTSGEDNSLWVPTETADDKAALSVKFRQAARLGWEKELEAMIAMGIDLSSQNDFGDTVLHEAIDWGRTDIVEIVLGHASQHNSLGILDTPNNSGNTPLHRAAFWRHEEIIRILKNYKARLDLRNVNEMSEAGVWALEAKCHKEDQDSENEGNKTVVFASSQQHRGEDFYH
jgi:hypothetical protein